MAGASETMTSADSTLPGYNRTLSNIADKLDFVADELAQRKTNIRNINAGIGVTKAAVVVGGVLTLGAVGIGLIGAYASLVLSGPGVVYSLGGGAAALGEAGILLGPAGAAIGGTGLAVLIYWLSGVAKDVLQKRELRNFDTDWQNAKRELRRNANVFLSPLSQNLNDADWARQNLNRATAEAVELMLQAGTHGRRSAERLKKLNTQQIEMVLGSLASIVLADLEGLELVTGCMAVRGQNACDLVRQMAREIRSSA